MNPKWSGWLFHLHKGNFCPRPYNSASAEATDIRKINEQSRVNSMKSLKTPLNHSLNLRHISQCLTVSTVYYSNLSSTPLLIRWCFVSSGPAVSFVLLSVCLSVHQKSRRFKTKREGTDYGNRPIKLAGKVIIQEISCLLPVHKALGESYMWATHCKT